MKILITGGLGFIGSNLAIKLVELGHEVTLIDSLITEYGGLKYNVKPIEKYVNVNISDIRDVHSLRHQIVDMDIIFNLAGQTSHMDSMKNPFVDLDINCRSQLFILETCREFNLEAKIVFASTRQIYGRPDYLPVNEEHPIRPVDVNGINKYAGESYHRLYNEVYGQNTTILRLTNTYGPRMRIKDARQTFLGIWIKKVLEGEKFEVWDGNQLRDYNFISDVINALLLCMDKPASSGQTYNLGHHEVLTLADTANLINKVHPCDFDMIEYPPERKKIDIGNYYSDYRKITEELGWKPRILFEEGIEATLEYYKENLKYYK